MNIAARLLCILTVLSLKGNTLAGDRVADSEIGTLDALIKKEPEPVIIVSVDEADGTMEDGLLNAQRVVTLLIELAVAAKVTLPAKEPGEGAVRYIEYRETSPAFETVLALLWRQIQRCLLTSAGGIWSAFWREFQVSSKEAEFHVKRGGDERGTRFASRYYLIDLAPVSDPEFGAEPESPWSDLFVTMRAAGEDFANIADTFQAEFEEPGGLVDWRAVQARLGITEEAVRGLGISPPYETTPDDLVAIDSYEAQLGTIDAARADKIAEPDEAE